MDVERLARRQHGVVSRSQALASGMTDKAIRWRLGRGDWRRVHRGIYLTNTGQLTWSARASAALLWCGPGSALVLDAALHAWRLSPEPPRLITVGVPAPGQPRAVAGVRPVRRRRLLTVQLDGLRVTKMAQTVVDIADDPARSIDDVVAVAARACQQHTVTEDGLLGELNSRARHARRRELRLALGDIGDGAESLPEVWFASRVQRPHGLPRFERQVWSAAGRERTDLKSTRYGVNVEVDGRLWHAGERFHSDRRRDRVAAGRGEVTLRISFLELDRMPCRLAGEVAQVLTRRGWTGHLMACSPVCAAAGVISA